MSATHLEDSDRNRSCSSVSNWIGRSFGVLIALILVLAPTMGHSQISGTGSIQGTVSDTSGAVIPNASVVLTNDATQVKHSVKQRPGRSL